MSFKMKIFIIISICILVPSILLSFLTYNSASKAITNQFVDTTSTSIDNSIAMMDVSLSATVNISRLMTHDDIFRDAIVFEDKDDIEELVANYKQLYTLAHFYEKRITGPNILSCFDSYYIYVPDMDIIMTSDSSYYTSISERMSAKQYGNIIGNFNRWYSSCAVNYYTLINENNIDSMISYNIPVYFGANKQAILIVNVSDEIFDSFFSTDSYSESSGAFVFAAQEAIYSDGYTGSMDYIVPNANGKTSFAIRETDEIVVCATSEHTGFLFAQTVARDSLRAQLAETKNYLVILIIEGSGLIFIVALIIIKIFFRPLEEIVHAMNEVENRNLDYRIKGERNDEFTKVYTGFNNMVSELNSVINDLGTEKSLNKEAQIKLLQEQLNPHFLYNTLDSTYSLVKMNRSEEAANMIMQLSKFFRSSLSSGRDIVRLSDALAIAESYLAVQKIRFGDRFSSYFYVPDRLLSYNVPKLVLQPFVENALVHGIERSVTNGLIEVVVYDHDSSLYMTVRDNGRGISPDKLKKINEMLASGELAGADNFAICNVNTQLKLLYGDSYGVSIDSTPGRGTKVTIHMPVR